MSAITRYRDLAMTRHRSGETTELAKEGGIAAGVAGALAFVSANSKTGLDVGVGKFKAPIDLGIGALAMAGSVFAPVDKPTRDMMRCAGSAALAVGVFRKGETFFKSKVSTAHGEIEDGFEDGSVDMGADPVVQAARNL